MGAKNCKHSRENLLRSYSSWMSREGPEGDCVIENDTTNSGSASNNDYMEEELSRAPSSHTANFTYKGYPVNLEWPFEPGQEKELPKKSFYYDNYPLEVVELPDLPDGKNVELTFEREGLVEASTQTKPIKEPTECGMSVKSAGSEHQEWSYTLYDFEGQGQVTRDDLKNLVQSIYEVLGKSVSQSRNQPKDPLKKLRVRLSVSKERGKDNQGERSQQYTISATTTQEHISRKNSKSHHMERCDSMTVNPPSLENIVDQRKVQNLMREAAGQIESLDFQSNSRKNSCKKCDQSRVSRPAVMPGGASQDNTPVVNERGAYNCPKRMQTGPGECNPPSPKQTEMSRVKEWVEQICTSHELERTETRRHKKAHRQHTCKQETNYDLHRCAQYLDLATDHITYPYHVQSHPCLYALPSPKPHRRPKRGHHHSCKYSREEGACPKTVVYRHEHHHHHNHHHYHHYVK